MDDLFQKLLILRTPKIGPVRFRELIGEYGSPVAAVDFLRPDDELKDAVMRETDAAQKLGIQYLADDDPRYPSTLRDLENHPPVLTVRGNIDVLSKPMVSMVGTRHATAAGMRFMSDLALAFADNGHAVVSGMAMGTDTAAHTGALRSGNKFVTVAVLAGGVDYIWPLENESLYHEITDRGAVISEMPVGFKPVASNFVMRNRWIAGMADKLILGEADSKSGSMATARFAHGYKKQVFAIPSHPSDARSVGPNSLIRSGVATLCMGVNDFFRVDSGSKKQKNNDMTDSENDIVDKLGIIPLSESVLAGLVKKSVVEIKRDLVVLELRGLVKKQDGGYIRI